MDSMRINPEASGQSVEKKMIKMRWKPVSAAVDSTVFPLGSVL